MDTRTLTGQHHLIISIIVITRTYVIVGRTAISNIKHRHTYHIYVFINALTLYLHNARFNDPRTWAQDKKPPAKLSESRKFIRGLRVILLLQSHRRRCGCPMRPQPLDTSLSCRRRNWSIRSIYNKYHCWSACLKIYADLQMADDSCERAAYCHILYL